MKEDRTLPYRCLIPPDSCNAIIKLGSLKIKCQIVDLSREDFQVRVPKGKVKMIRAARRIELRYHDERWQVSLAGSCQAAAETVYLKREKELTKTKLPSPWTALTSLGLSQQTDPRFVFTLMVAFIFACIALPGLGDKIGSAPRLKKGIHSVMSSFK